MVTQKNPVLRIGVNFVKQANQIGESVSYELQKEATYHKKWITEQFGKIRNVSPKQTGGQPSGAGPDVLSFIKKHDPSNSSGAFKDSLDIMLKLQDATDKSDLFSSIRPLKTILGGGLYGKMKAAGAQSKASGKARKENKSNDDDIIAALIAAAMAIVAAEDPEIAVLSAELLNSNEISLIRDAYYKTGVYASTIMPTEFVKAINYLIPIFQATRAIV